MYKNIVVPYDSSVHAKHALEAAIDLASNEPEAHITILTVVDPPDFDATFEAAARMAGIAPINTETAHVALRQFIEEHEQHVRDSIEEAGTVFPENVGLDVKVITGRPQEAVGKYVSGKDYDCIVMGNRGLGPIRGALGSVSYAVLRTVEIPVLVVK